MEKEIISVNTATVIEAFETGDGLDDILGKVREEAKNFKADANTETGRKSISAFAYKITRFKTKLDNLAKEQVVEKKRVLRRYDTHRKKMRDSLDDLRDEVRAPLLEWEKEQERKKQAINEKIEKLNQLLMSGDDSIESIEEKIKFAESFVIDSSFEEEELRAYQTQKRAIEHLKDMLNQKIKLAELEKKRKEEEAKLMEAEKKRRKLEQEKLIAEAEERAKKQAEERAKKEIEKAKIKAEKERERAEKEKENRIREQKEAKIMAEKQAKQAVIEEKRRVAEEKAKAEAELKRREENKRHREKIEKEAIESLVEKGFSWGNSTSFVSNVSNGNIKHIFIRY